MDVFTVMACFRLKVIMIHGSILDLRKELIERISNDISTLKRADDIGNIQDIFLGSITDSYQPLEVEHKRTRQIIELLISNELPFTILTKSNLVLRDLDLFKGYKWCRVGVTVTSFDELFRKELEPFTANYNKRIEVLSTLKLNGINTYLSGEPIMPLEVSNPLEIVCKLRDYVDLFDFGIVHEQRLLRLHTITVQEILQE